jgi:hypothetical protein
VEGVSVLEDTRDGSDTALLVSLVLKPADISDAEGVKLNNQIRLIRKSLGAYQAFLPLNHPTLVRETSKHDPG